MNVERERIRECVARLFTGGAVAAELTDYIERNARAPGPGDDQKTRISVWLTDVESRQTATAARLELPAEGGKTLKSDAKKAA
jgi:hypothetical protein